MSMKRENYLKPQTIMEHVAMEQGICAGSVMANPNGVKVTKHETGFDGTYIHESDDSPFQMTEWN